MNKKYNLKLDLQFRCNNSTMKFNQFDNNTSDFFMRITNGGNLVDIEKAIVVLAIIKPSGKVASQFVEVENGLVYADLKPSMKDEIGTYTAQAMLILEDERVVTDAISYEVEEDKIFSLLNDSVRTSEEFTLLTDMLSRLSTIETNEEQRVINEAERILSEENRKIEEVKRVEAELIRQHEEADRAKYDAIRESNENIRKQNESIRLTNETNRIDEEAKRVEEEDKRKLAEEERNANYNFMTEDEERRRSEANAHKEAEVLRVQAENTRVNEEAKRRTTEQARVSAENTRVSNENTREANEVTRQTNETQRVEAETQRQSRYNSFILDAEANANNFENYTNSAKIKEEERKSNELNRKSQEDRRVSNEVERISNENTRKANEKARQNNETTRQNTFANKVNEVDKKIIELNTTKDNFVSSISTKVDNKITEIDNVKDNFVSSVNTKVDSKISELDTAKSDMTNTVANKVNEVENRFNALTSKQQQDAEVVDARDGETSLKARLDRDIEKAKQVYAPVEGSHISTDSSVGYAKDIEILGNTIQSASNLADIKSVGDKVEGQELYEIPVLSVGKNLYNGTVHIGKIWNISSVGATLTNQAFHNSPNYNATDIFCIKPNTEYIAHLDGKILSGNIKFYDKDKKYISEVYSLPKTSPNNAYYCTIHYANSRYGNGNTIQLEEGTVATPYEPYIEDKLTILSPTPLEKVGDVRDRIIEKDGVWGVEKNVETVVLSGSEDWSLVYRGTVINSYRIQFNQVKPHINTSNELCNIVCDKFIPYTPNGRYRDVEQITVASWDNGSDMFINKSRSDVQDVNDFKQWLQANNVAVKYPTTKPQFIPLPHDQQVKLRTFAGKTNISFECEIEGTIKAQVPKSLGATVNTHTEQINNLNKELDRVKKLEESTVSTVTTESDFTTVEATSNGYFEDVKLEGKTLVNLAKSTTVTLDSVIDSNRLYSIPCNKSIQKGKIYTLFARCTAYNFNGTNGVKFGNWGLSGGTVNDATICKGVGGLAYKFTVNKNATTTAVQVFVDANTEGSVTLTDFTILEGDYTQNPPNGYIEGLKSVGQDVEEIVVSSCNGNYLNNDKFVEHIKNVASGVLDSQNKTITFIASNASKIHYKFNDLPNGSYILVIKGYNTDATQSSNITINYTDGTFDYVGSFVDGYAVREINKNKTLSEIGGAWQTGSTVLYYDECYLIKSDNLDYTYKQDKKRLLYYNTETQTWEKPILRQWDSIEKHANSKYYYHVRSIEEDYTRGDEIVTDYITDMTTTVKPLSQEKIYECTNIDLITYNGETNYIVESGAIVPKTTLKVHNNISNVVSLLQKKVSLLESNIKASQEVQDMMILETDMRMLDIELALIDFMPMALNLGGSDMLRSATYFNFLKNHIVNETYEKEYLENVMNKYLATGRINQDEYNELYKMLYPPVYDIELPIEY